MKNHKNKGRKKPVETLTLDGSLRSYWQILFSIIMNKINK